MEEKPKRSPLDDSDQSKTTKDSSGRLRKSRSAIIFRREKRRSMSYPNGYAIPSSGDKSPNNVRRSPGLFQKRIRGSVGGDLANQGVDINAKLRGWLRGSRKSPKSSSESESGNLISSSVKNSKESLEDKQWYIVVLSASKDAYSGMIDVDFYKPKNDTIKVASLTFKKLDSTIMPLVGGYLAKADYVVVSPENINVDEYEAYVEEGNSESIKNAVCLKLDIDQEKLITVCQPELLNDLQHIAECIKNDDIAKLTTDAVNDNSNNGRY